MNYKRLLNISRPRFWVYVLGTFLVGLSASGNLLSLSLNEYLLAGVLFLFFTYPANILIYGVNDIFDYETDKHNPKKIEYEELVTPTDQKKLTKHILFWVIPFVVLVLWMQVLPAIIFGIFLLCSVFYSAWPIRAKIHPPFDIIFSSLIYITPGVLGFLVAGGNMISWQGAIAGLLWAFAMQTYSAVPDIQADTTAGIKTLATVLGAQGSLWFCGITYVLSAILAHQFIGWLAIIFASVYVGLVVYTALRPRQAFLVYKKFPWVNTVSGMILFFYLFFGL